MDINYDKKMKSKSPRFKVERHPAIVPLLFLLFIMLVFILLFLIFIRVHKEADTVFTTHDLDYPDSEQEIIENCSFNYTNHYRSLTKSVSCYINYLKPIFNYSANSGADNPTFNYLKERGGNCKSYSLFGKRMFLELGFYTASPVIKTSASSSHRILIVSSDDGKGYCVIDQLNYECFGLE